MAGKTPRPLGSTPHPIDKGTLVRHRSPVPGTLGRSVDQRSLATLVFDANALDLFFRSVAYAELMASHLSLHPMHADKGDSPIMKAIIAVMPDRWLPEEVELPVPSELDKEVNAAKNDLGAQFWYHLDHGGPTAVQKFLEELNERRQRARDYATAVFRKAGIQNEHADAVAQRIYTGLCITKMASTITVAALGLPEFAVAGSAWATFSIGTSYSVALKVIKEWDAMPGAQLVAVIAKDQAIDKGKDKAGDAAREMAKIYASEAQNEGTAARKLEWLLKRQAAGSGSRVESRIAETQLALRAARKAKWISKGLSAVPYLFFAWGVKDAWDTFEEDMGKH